MPCHFITFAVEFSIYRVKINNVAKFFRQIETVGQFIENINHSETALKKQNSSIQWVFFEPDME